jgi:hypothetical protein
MGEEVYIKPDKTSIDKLAEDYLKHDSFKQMQLRNGMTRELFFDYSLLLAFINKNGITLGMASSSEARMTDAKLLAAAEACGECYGERPARLYVAYRRCSSFEFYDYDRKQGMLRMYQQIGMPRKDVGLNAGSKVFIACNSGGVPEELDSVLRPMSDALFANGHMVTCSFFLEEFFQHKGFDRKQVYEHMLKLQRRCDTFLAFIDSAQLSKGMQMESDLALYLRQRYVVASRQGIVLPQFHGNANQFIEFADYPELIGKIKRFE